jgi:RNA-directed DNA polymerase
VMSTVRGFIEKRLGLRINEQKSKVDRPRNRKFLGFSFFRRLGIHVRIAPKAIERFKARIREITSRSNGWGMERRIRALIAFRRGWAAYFRLATARDVLTDLDKWTLRRLRLCQWKQWKRIRTRLRELRALGLPEWRCREIAFSRKAYWRMSGGPLNSAMPRAHWRARGIIPLSEYFAGAPAR